MSDAQAKPAPAERSGAPGPDPDALTGLVRGQIEATGEQGRRAVSTWLRDVTMALADAGTQLETDGHAVTALCANTAAARLGELGSFVEARSLNDLADEYADFAGRRPYFALGLAFAAGLGAAALLQARDYLPRDPHRSSGSDG
jgi:hypothetical protein